MKIEFRDVEVTTDEEGTEYRRLNAVLYNGTDDPLKFGAAQALSKHTLRVSGAPDKLRHHVDNLMRNEVTRAMIEHHYGD